MSLTDPNIRHVLSLVRESFTDAPPEHFAIVRPPQRDDFTNEDQFRARATQHRLWAKDLGRYGFVAVEVDRYDEVPQLLRRVERPVAENRVWISGSWPIHTGGEPLTRLHQLAFSLGRLVGDMGLDLVSGSGLLIGSASIGGFIDALRVRGGWDIERRLIVRPFPQPLPGDVADRAEWTLLRREMARLAGIVIFVGGIRQDAGAEVTADGVLEEFALAREAGVFLLPLGATGGAARLIAEELRGSNLPAEDVDATRPTDEELTYLLEPAWDHDATVTTVRRILERRFRAT